MPSELVAAGVRRHHPKVQFAGAWTLERFSLLRQGRIHCVLPGLKRQISALAYQCVAFDGLRGVRYVIERKRQIRTVSSTAHEKQCE